MPSSRRHVAFVGANANAGRIVAMVAEHQHRLFRIACRQRVVLEGWEDMGKLVFLPDPLDLVQRVTVEVRHVVRLVTSFRASVAVFVLSALAQVDDHRPARATLLGVVVAGLRARGRAGSSGDGNRTRGGVAEEVSSVLLHFATSGST